MGIQGLCRFLGDKTEGNGVSNTNLNSYRGQIFGIDTSNLIHKHLGNEEHMVKMISKICYKFLKHGIYPLFVFDSRIKKNKTSEGVAAASLMSEERKKHEEEHKQMMSQLSEDKKKTISKRYNLRKKNKNFSTLYQKIQEYRESNSEITLETFQEQVNSFINEINESTEEVTQKIKDTDINIEYYYSCRIDEIIEKKEVSERISNTIVSNDIYYFKSLLDFYGIAYVEAYGEADGMLAQLCNENVVDAVVSDDSDLLAFGCKKLLRNFDVHNDEITEYRLDNILETLSLSYSQFLDMCILMGTDFNERLRKSPEVIYDMILKNHDMHGVVQTLPRIPSNFLSSCEKTRDIFYRRTPDYYIEYTRGIMNNISHENNDELSKIIHLTFMNIRKIVKMQKESRLTNFVDYLNVELTSSSSSDSSEEEVEQKDSADTRTRYQRRHESAASRPQATKRTKHDHEQSTYSRTFKNSYSLLTSDDS